MGQPTPYTKTKSFAGDEAGAVGGRSTILTAGLDTELVNIQTTLTGALSSLAKILRDDDKIKDGLLTPNGFSLSDADGYLQRKAGTWLFIADPLVATATARDLAIAARVAAELARDLAQAYRDAASTSATNAATQAGLATSNGAAQVALAAAQVALATTEADNAAASAAGAATQAGLATSNGATQVGLAAAQVALATTQANNAASSASSAAADKAACDADVALTHADVADAEIAAAIARAYTPAGSIIANQFYYSPNGEFYLVTKDYGDLVGLSAALENETVPGERSDLAIALTNVDYGTL